MGNVAPEAGLQETVTITNEPPERFTVSLPVLKGYTTTAPDALVASTIILALTTITEKLAWDELPDASVATQSTIVDPTEKVEPEAGEHASVGCGSTMSVAAVANDTIAPAGPVASAVTDAGTVNTGAVVSTIVTMKLALAMLPEASVAIQTT